MWLDRKFRLREFANVEFLKKFLNNSSVLDAFSKKAYLMATIVWMIESHKILGDVLTNLLPEDERWCIFPTKNKVKNFGHDGPII